MLAVPSADRSTKDAGGTTEKEPKLSSLTETCSLLTVVAKPRESAPGKLDFVVKDLTLQVVVVACAHGEEFSEGYNAELSFVLAAFGTILVMALGDVVGD
jgi:hypothetical protein